MALIQYLKDRHNIKDIELLLHDGVDPNCVDAVGNCALHYCVQHKYNIPIEVARLLIKHKTDVNTCNRDGCTPLMTCLFYRGSHEMVRLLLENGGQIGRLSAKSPFNSLIHLCVNYKDNLGVELVKLFIKSDYDFEVLDVSNKGTPLISFVRNKCDVEMIRLLLEAGADPNLTDYFSCSALHYCTRYRNNEGLDVLRTLISHGADVNIVNGCGETPLTSFILNDCTIEMIGVLLECGTDPNIKNHNGKTALHYCTKYDSSRVADIIGLLILHRANINAEDIVGMTPFVQFMAENMDIELVKMLLALGADPNIQDEMGDNALHLCIKYEVDRMCLTALLIEFNTNVNAVNKMGMTPMMSALQNTRYKDFLLLLLRSGADPNIGCRNGESALHMCLKYDDETGFDIVNALIKHEADVNAVNKSGETVLMRFIKKSNCQRIIKLLLDNDASVVLIEAYALSHRYLQESSNFSDDYYGPYLMQMFISSGYNVNVKNDDDESPLISFVSSACKSDVIQMLLNAGVDTNIAAKNGCTALHYCTNYNGENCIDVVRLLMEHGADVNAIDNEGETPLMKFIYTNTDETAVQMLVDAGATITAPSQNSCTRDMIQSCAIYSPWLAEYLLDMFINSGYVVSSKSKETSKTPLMCFLENGHRKEAIEKLLDAEADPHCTDEFGNNCLHYIDVSKKGSYVYTLMKFLLHRRVYINATGKFNRNPLLNYLLKFQGDDLKEHKKVIKMFLKLGADPNERDELGRDALYTLFKCPLMNELRLYVSDDTEFSMIIQTLVTYNADLFASWNEADKEGTITNYKPMDLYTFEENTMGFESFFTLIKYLLVEDSTIWERYQPKYRHLIRKRTRINHYNSKTFEEKVATYTKELSRMKSYYIKNSISILDYCRAKTPRKLGLHFVGSNLNTVDKCELRASFPQYFKLIKAKIFVGKRFAEILNKINSIRIYSSFNANRRSVVMLNSYSFQYLISYLSETELLKIIEASNGR